MLRLLRGTRPGLPGLGGARLGGVRLGALSIRRSLVCCLPAPVSCRELHSPLHEICLLPLSFEKKIDFYYYFANTYLPK